MNILNVNINKTNYILFLNESCRIEQNKRYRAGKTIVDIKKIVLS